MIAGLRLLLISIAISSTAYGQLSVVYEIPQTLESVESKAELRYCSLWLRCKGDKVEQIKSLLERLEKDKLEVPYRWRAALEASLDSDFQSLEGGGINAAVVLPVRRKPQAEDTGEILMLNKKKLTISLVEKDGPGGGYRVPDAVLDGEHCYVIVNHPGTQIVITNVDTNTGKNLWKTTIPLVSSAWEQTGSEPHDRLQDVQFTDRNGERVLVLWNHFAGEYAFTEITCKDGSIRIWFSSQIEEHPNFTQTP